ncbi:MAG: PEP-CTERM sorting domain-containing protein [Phycisphaerae bacterium]|nr:PEP-CTERM sorting domain-containing protein [Phycisphaerae bacterium]
MRSNHLRSVTLSLIVIGCLPAIALGGSAVDTLLFNATTNTGGDDPAGLGTNYASSPPLFGTDVIEDAFGNNDGPIEPTTFLFADAGTVDNGNSVIGDGGETVDWLSWNTTQLVVLDGYRVGLGSEGPPQGYNRGTELFSFGVAGEQDDFFDDNGQSGPGTPVARYFAIPQVGNSFAVNLTRTTTSGPRIDEIDAIVPEAPAPDVFTDPILFNATTLGAGDEAAGLALNFASSATIPGDTIEDAFGNQDGGIEPSSLIFSDAGAVADNRNNTFDVGVETIDWISWDTTRLVELHGYQLGLSPDGESDYRGTELVRFFVDDVLVDIIDFNHSSGTIDRIFAGGPVVGDSFRIELTRTIATGGSRVLEINAIIPEPGSLGLLGLAGVLGLVRRWRVR